MSTKPLTLDQCTTRAQLEKLFLSTVQELAYTRSNVEVFRDFVNLSACAFRNSIPFAFSHDTEAEYMKIIGKYSREKCEPDKFALLLAITVEALELAPSDFLGHVYMYQEMGNEHAGQFFTPSSVAKMMARVSLGDMKKAVEESQCGYITINDPACGGAVTLIEAISEAKEQGIDHSRQLCVYAEDIDTVCVHMAYVQLSLLGVPALVSHRDTLRMETWSQWKTPVWVLNGFDFKEQRRMANVSDARYPEHEEPQDKQFTVDFNETRQLELFAI